METIVDQLKTVNSKSFLNEIKNPENITNLILKNFNNETNWEELNKFTKLKEIQLENCLIDNNSFFSSISTIKNLKVFRYSSDCYFKNSEKKIKINPISIEKVVLDFYNTEEINLSLLSFQEISFNF